MKWFSSDTCLLEELTKNDSRWSDFVRPSIEALIYCLKSHMFHVAWFSYSDYQQVDINEDEVYDTDEVSHWTYLPKAPVETIYKVGNYIAYKPTKITDVTAIYTGKTYSYQQAQKEHALKMKAYACYDMPVNRHYTIIYAINAGKAKSIAWNIFNKDDFVISYTDIRVRRLPILDDCYKGETLVD